MIKDGTVIMNEVILEAMKDLKLLGYQMNAD